MLCVSQFTLYADVRRGNRPGFTAAAVPELAEPLVERVASRAARRSACASHRGSFGAHMQVSLVNDGPGDDLAGYRGLAGA